MAREINLVPDIKNEMIKALKLRNLIFFISLIVAIISISATAITAIIAGGQQLAIDSKKGTINNLSSKLNSYADLKDFLTIRDQISDINDLTSNKKVLSRTFNILSALLPTGPDTIKISELNVDLTTEAPTFTFDAQANAGAEPFIDYNVLDAFKKSMKFMRYDHGDYVDTNGDKIPAYCMIEAGDDGSIFNDPERGLYAFWTINAEGCAPASSSSAEDDEATAPVNPASGYSTENYNGQEVVRIWRTPQFNDWYNATESQSKITLDGQISGVPHFESACVTYTGYDKPDYTATSSETVLAKTGNITWVSQNDSCLLVPEEEAGISIYDSSNGRGEDGELVLRFSSTINFAPEVFDFNNSHMLALAPSGRRNVTDSYVQIQAMFSERAADCTPGDTTCANAQTKDDTNSSNSADSTKPESNSNERNQNG